LTAETSNSSLMYATMVALAAWAVPGGGHFILGQRIRGVIIFVSIAALFAAGLYVGSIGVIDPVGARLWYIGQMLTSPAVSLIGRMNPSVGGVPEYPSYGKPFEVGQIYTSIAGALNFLCILNAAYIAYRGKQPPGGD
jgi:hypothetical protein